MIAFNKSVFVATSASQAFFYSTEPEFFNRWIPGVMSNRKNSKGPFGIGTTLLQEIKHGFNVEQVAGRVVAWEKDVKWSYVGHAEKFWFHRTIRFEPLPQGTKIHYSEELHLKETGLLVVSPLLRYLNASLQQKGLDILKADLESRKTTLANLKR